MSFGCVALLVVAFVAGGHSPAASEHLVSYLAVGYGVLAIVTRSSCRRHRCAGPEEDSAGNGGNRPARTLGQRDSLRS